MQTHLTPTPTSKTNPSAQDANKGRYAITIGKTPDEIFAFWRDFKNLALFMKGISDIQVRSEKKSHWVVELKSGLKAEWDAEITAETPGEMISWASVEGAPVKTTGTVWFESAPGDKGTVVSVSMDYHVPAGKLGELAAFFTGESPDLLIKTNLKRLKAYLETGEIATTEGQPSGREPGATDVSPHSVH